jgi:two-component system sensor histidine kinase KdpD
VFLPDGAGELGCAHASEGFAPPDGEERGIVRWVSANGREAGLGTSTVPGGEALYLPLATTSARRDVGVLGVFPSDRGRFDDPEQRRLASALAAQAAIALERVELGEEARRAHLEIEAERLRSTLLSSVSHDLRTPLAVMKGAASTLVDDDAVLAPSARVDLAATLLEETERLERLVRNLLDMTRLESGAVRVHKEWQSVEEAVGGALARVEAKVEGRPVTTDVPAALLAPFDGVLVEQVLVNLLENAAKYTPEGAPVDVSAAARGGEVTIEVADRGPGLPPGEEARVFEKFHRGKADVTAPGVGLGLAICRAVAVAHGGRMEARNREGGGAVFTLSLPLEGVAPRVPLPEIEEKQEEA